MRFCWHDWDRWEWIHFTEKGYGYSREMISQEWQMKTCKKCNKTKKRLT